MVAKCIATSVGITIGLGLFSDVYQLVRYCSKCSKERVLSHKLPTHLQLFPTTASLEDIAMDLFGALVTTTCGNRYILIITDSFSKLVRVISSLNTKAINIAKVFNRDWVFVYGPPLKILSDSFPQFSARLLLETNRLLGVRELFTTA